jgi:copper chaperone
VKVRMRRVNCGIGKAGREMAEATLKITGMTCQHCVRAVTGALEGQDGVTRAEVDLQAGRARVEYDEALVTPRELADAVVEEGYEAEEGT